jgi:TolB-like protein
LKFTTLLKIWILLGAGVLGLQPGAQAAVARVAIVPFQINADKDYSFLQKGIVDMLSSRLSWADKVEVIDPTATARALESKKAMSGDRLALAVATDLKADFALYGSITLLGESVSIDAKMLDVTGTRPPLTFFKQTQGMGAVIPQIDLLAGDINRRVFNHQTAAPAVPQPSAEPARENPGSDVHAHPDTLLQGLQNAGGGGSPGPPAASLPAPAASPLNPAFESTQATARGGTAADFWKSRNFDFLINGMDVGDVNHDGLAETVLVTPEEVLIYQFAKGRMQEIAKIETPGAYNVGVDIGDINGNGTPEIFVSSLNNRRTILESQVLEFDGRAFKPIVKDVRWYFRVVHHPVRGDILLGQHQLAGGADPLSSPIFEMTWKGAEYVEGALVLPARKANLLGLTYGDIRNDKSDTIVAYNSSENLRMYAPNGEDIWTSGEYYGGSPVYFALPPDSPGDQQKPFFLPIRTRLVDLNGDQKTEVLVAQNVDSANRKLAQQRFYTSTRIMALVWDGLGLTPAWQTRKLSGRIQDLAVADFDNDGKKELLAAVVSKEGSFIGTHPQSALIAYDLNLKP